MPERSTGRAGRPSTGVREALLEAAQAVLSESGAARLTTRAVAQRAGVAEASVFYHFGDRPGLLLAVVGEYLPQVVELFFGERLRHGTLRADLLALFEGLESFFLRTAPVVAAVQADSEVREAFRERSRRHDIGPHRAIEGTAAFLAARQAAGELPPDADLRAAAMLLVGAAYQRAYHRLLGAAGAQRWLAEPAETVDLLLRGLRAKQTDRP
ncbi:TetR/AcrR family transcriptional regulator [Actinocrinis puniceicyclus]|uniref:TetR/AcrR family transcriptional regulator n=1 Tax=Actinocrinis puniceicyclus TaxID=977794 RepID=A0A8J8BCP7_9ACTN|nr:TetR/AcrR family transcriptional regulator [Actinocrinis puniceicyclus]MBS2963336.1 TetR/AcrR family transcriptional regulator [Actinocrinis puniceicyclus]